MTNIQKIKFDAKFSVSYMNGKYVISGFNHTYSLHIKDRCDELNYFIEDYELWNLREKEWEDLVNTIKKEGF